MSIPYSVFRDRHTLAYDEPAERGQPLTWTCTCGWHASASKKDWYALKLSALRHRRQAIGEDVRKACGIPLATQE